jgi:SAM-dependent methyltransferase
MYDVLEREPSKKTHSNLFIERCKCPVCGSGNPATLFSAPYTGPVVRGFISSHYRNQGQVDFSLLEGVDFTIHECQDCSLIFQRMAPTDRMMHILYDQFINPENLKRFEMAKLTTDNFRNVAIRFADLFELMGKRPTDIRMLDFGFGYGRWARVAVAMGAKVFAIEISPDKREFARSIGVTIIAEEDLPNHKFDLVHTEQVFEHLTDPVAVFDMLAPCVADDGFLKIAVPVQGKIRKLLKNGFIDWSPAEFNYPWKVVDYGTMMPLEHVNAFSRKSIEVLARRGGFDVGIGSFGGRHVDLDIGSMRSLVNSCKQWGVRVAKDLYVRCGPGIQDCSYYLLSRGT